MELLSKLRKLLASSTGPTPISAGELLMPTGNAMKCPACNTLVQGEGFDPRQIAEVMAEKGMGHVPMCVIGM